MTNSGIVKGLCLATFLGAAVVVGCQAAPGAGVAPRPGGPATAGAAAAAGGAAASLPAQARVPLADLKPAASRPVNPPDADKAPAGAERDLTEAETLLARNEFVRALAASLERVRGFAPASGRVQRGLGLAYIGLGDRVKAEAALRASVKAAPDHMRVHMLLGVFARQANRLDEAQLSLRTALLCADARQENPDAAETLVVLAQVLEQQGLYQAALDAYRQLERLFAAHGRAYAARPALQPLVTQPEKFQVAQGVQLMRLGRPAEAAPLLEGAYRADKTNADVARLAVRANLERKDFAAAQTLVVEMVREPAQLAGAVELGKELCRQRKDPAGPRKLLEACLAKGHVDPMFVIAMAEAALELNSGADAAEMLGKHAAATPGNADSVLRLVTLYERTGKPAEAAKLLATLLAAEDADVSVVRDPAVRLGAAGAKEPLIKELTAAADKAAGLEQPALLTVAGLMADGAGLHELAVATLMRTIDRHMKFWPAYEALQDVLLGAGEFAAVEKLSQAAIKAAGTEYAGFYITGRGELERGLLEEALASLNRARAARADHLPTLLLLGRALGLQGKHTEALAPLGEALKLAPDDPRVNQELFRQCVQQNATDDARRVVARLLQRNPRSLPGRIMLVQLYRLVNEPDNARRVLKELTAEAPNEPEVMLLAVQMDLPSAPGGGALPAAQAEAAIARLQALLRLDPRDLQAQFTLALLLANQDKHAQAAQIWNKVYLVRPFDQQVVSHYLDALLKAAQDEQTLAAVERMAAHPQTKSAAARQMLIEALVRLKKYDRAETLLLKWVDELERKGGAPAELLAFRLRTVMVYEAAKEFAKAQALLDAWLAKGADESILPGLRAQKLRLYGLAGKLDDAEAYAKKWQAEDTDDDEPRRALLGAYEEAKQYERAVAVLDQWIAIAPPDQAKGLRVRRLLNLARQGKHEAILPEARKWAAGLAGEERNLPYEVAVGVLLEQKQYELAVQAAQAWCKEADGPEAQAAHVETLIAADKPKDALAQANKYLAAAPKNLRLLKAKAAALKAVDDEDQAITVLEEAYALAPDDEGLNNDLGYTWADKGIKLDKAEAMIRKALAERPGSIAVQDSLAWVLYKRGRFEEARAIFTRVLAAAEEDDLHAVIVDHAGDTLWRVGRKDEAGRLWQRALDLAKKEKRQDRETKKVQADAAAKLEAVKKARPPKLAPLGEGVAEPK